MANRESLDNFIKTPYIIYGGSNVSNYGWSPRKKRYPFFEVVSAAVTEIGSTTSHAAIVAREYGIPAVVAIDNVTSVLKDGQRIRVDGTNGVITLL